MTSNPPQLPVSRWSDARALIPGVRVVIRRRLTADGPHGGPRTDVIGVLQSLDPLVVRDKHGREVTVDRELVEIIKPLPSRPVRNRDIRAVEAATADAFPGLEHHWVDGWYVRIADGVTERSNSAVPLRPQASMDFPFEDIHSLYQSHGLPTMVELPDRISPPKHFFSGPWALGPDILVLTRNLDHLPTLREIDGISWEIMAQPDPGWFDLYHFRGEPLPTSSLELLRTQIDGTMAFGRLRAGDRTVAITRGTVTESPDGRTWLGYSAVEVVEDYRRRGLASLLGAVMLQWGQEQGADEAYLQVIESNEAGRGLYAGLGFTEHHRHRYATYLGQ